MNPANGVQLAPKPAKSWKKEWLAWLRDLAIVLAVVVLLRGFVFDLIRVDGSSMADTLQTDEMVFVLKAEYLFTDPERFDVVICHYPNRRDANNPLGIEMKTNFVKRVIGLPGETIAIQGNTVYINGQPLQEPFLTPERNQIHMTLGPVTLGEDQYFMIGDNRYASNDSRNLQEVGPIARDEIVGEVKFVFFPFSSIRGI